ncbi:integrase [Paraburkholderia sp. RP-4-7]|uniref:Integrase n=1 Tax=Paraburkholderia polaris TaxID=2728848 RepID=A0A848IA34_9BURK|nr:integrase [Paraburkholderia polaris]NML98400.1 integrase [Paraburkholderia polaris]
MSTPVLNFTPRAELEALANLEAFVALCRGSDVLGAAAQFDKNVWVVGYFKGHNKVNRVIFSTLEASREDKPVPSLPHPFLDFAKATLVYLHDKRPVTSQGPRIAALRCMEAALRELSKGSRPTAVDEIVLDSAVELAKQKVSPGVAYRTAGQIEYIADFMRSKGFIRFRQSWAHGVKKPQEVGSRISKEALAARQEKLPSAATLRALGAIFHDAIEPTDILVASNTGLMLCAPERINEVMRLRRNCLVEGDGEFRGKLGLRWSGSKGFENTTKWLPTEMVPIARKAVANIIKVTTSAQKLAAWYTENPKKLYLPEGAEELRDTKVLSLEEIALILWGDETASESAKSWAHRTNKLPKQSLSGHPFGFLFEDVERTVVAMLPETFPYVPGAPELLCSESMALMRTNETHSEKATYLCMFSCVDSGVITNRFGAREGRRSIFERFNYTEDDGSPIELQSHSLRHYLNMLAQTGGLSSAEIAIFSGRADKKQNRPYDHMTSDEVQAPISQALKDGFTSELEPVLGAGRELFTRSEFKGLGLTAAHTTDYGWCAHDFASEPCQMYRDCINCEEQECIKGDQQKEANLRLLKSETEYLLKQAQEALSEEEYGADTWVKHQLLTLERVNALLSILEDPAVPVGARIRLDVSNAPLITTDDVHPVKVIKFTRRKVLA